jgi:hypothetical protein
MPLPIVWIERIFEHFHGRFGNAFLTKWQIGLTNHAGLDIGVENAKKVWASELSGYSPDEVKRGLSARYAYPPSLDEFQNNCRPEIDYEHAYLEACTQMVNRKKKIDKWSSPLVFWAATRFGNDLSAYPYQTIKTRWRSMLDKTREDIQSGKLPSVIPQYKKELPRPGKVTVAKEVAAKHFAKMHEIIDRKILSKRAQ